jgi:hypothetical protein
MTYQAPEDVDFFAASADAATPTVEDTRTPTAAAKVSTWRDRIKPPHVLGVAGVLALTWVLWPYLFGGGELQPPKNAVNPQASRYFASPDEPRSPVIASQPKDLRDAALRPIVASAPALETTSTVDVATAKLAELQNRIAELEAQLSQAQAQAHGASR